MIDELCAVVVGAFSVSERGNSRLAVDTYCGDPGQQDMYKHMPEGRTAFSTGVCIGFCVFLV